MQRSFPLLWRYMRTNGQRREKEPRSAASLPVRAAGFRRLRPLWRAHTSHPSRGWIRASKASWSSLLFLGLPESLVCSHFPLASFPAAGPSFLLRMLRVSGSESDLRLRSEPVFACTGPLLTLLQLLQLLKALSTLDARPQILPASPEPRLPRPRLLKAPPQCPPCRSQTPVIGSLPAP